LTLLRLCGKRLLEDCNYARHQAGSLFSSQVSPAKESHRKAGLAELPKRRDWLEQRVARSGGPFNLAVKYRSHREDNPH